MPTASGFGVVEYEATIGMAGGLDTKQSCSRCRMVTRPASVAKIRTVRTLEVRHDCAHPCVHSTRGEILTMEMLELRNRLAARNALSPQSSRVGAPTHPLHAFDCDPSEPGARSFQRAAPPRRLWARRRDSGRVGHDLRHAKRMRRRPRSSHRPMQGGKGRVADGQSRDRTEWPKPIMIKIPRP